MKAYLLLSGILYLLLFLAHVARVVAEGASVAASPIFVVTTLAAVVMAGWSWRLLQQMRHSVEG